MGLRELRKNRNLTQRELAQMSGVNFRSLQDYEQGHKKLSSASGDILLRLSTVLGCATEELLLDAFEGASILPHNQMSITQIQTQQFFCEKYKTSGRWVCSGSAVATMFYYAGEQHILPFRAIFDEKHLPWLKEAAALQMEAKIDDILFSQTEMEA